MKALIWQLFCHYQSQDHVTDVKNSKISLTQMKQPRFYRWNHSWTGTMPILWQPRHKKEYFKNVTKTGYNLYETYLVISYNVFGFYSHI